MIDNTNTAWSDFMALCRRLAKGWFHLAVSGGFVLDFGKCLQELKRKAV
jgi:hypothetical protein